MYLFGERLTETREGTVRNSNSGLFSKGCYVFTNTLINIRDKNLIISRTAQMKLHFESREVWGISVHRTFSSDARDETRNTYRFWWGNCFKMGYWDNRNASRVLLGERGREIRKMDGSVSGSS
jgi:hypothetical protein